MSEAMNSEGSPLIKSEQEMDDKNQHIKRGTVDIPHTVDTRFSWRKLWAFSGPGWLMSIAYIDPGNLESDLQAGAQAGYSLLWVLWWCTIIGMFLQLLSSKLGVCTGMNLAQICRKQYSARCRYILWIMMEIAIISSDIQEVIGSALAISILSNHKIPLWAGSLITGIDTFTFLLLERYGMRKLEALFAVLITTMSITFGYMFYAIDANAGDIAIAKLYPRVEKGASQQAIAILGAVIMPHNLYLHSALVISRKIDTTNLSKIKEANFYYSIETGIALFVSFMINLFVLAVFAHGFTNADIDTRYQVCNENYQADINNYVCEAQNIDLASSGCCLGIRFGDTVKYIWAIGLLAAGQSSTMTGTYAGQFVMEGFLQIKIAPWKRVLITRSCAMVPTVAVALVASPRTLGELNEWMNVLQAFQLPFALVPLLHFTGMKSIMGVNINGPIAKGFGWILSLVVIAINLEQFTMFSSLPIYGIVLVGIGGAIYTIFVLYLILAPLFKSTKYGQWYKDVSTSDTSINKNDSASDTTINDIYE